MSAVEVMDENNICVDGSVEFVEDMSESFVGSDDEFDFGSKKNSISSTERLKMDGYSAYVSESAKYKLLTPEEELYYGRLSQSGDIKARNILVTHNLRLVVSMARKMRTSIGLSLIDLISHGNVGLITAAEKYDPKAGCRFSTYATYWIFQSLQRAVAKDGRLIRTPVHMIQLQNRIFREDRKYEAAGLKPDDEAICKLLEINLEALKEARSVSLSMYTYSLDAPLSSDEPDGSTLIDTIEDESSSFIDKDHVIANIKEMLGLAMNSLSEKELRVIKLRFGLDEGSSAMILEEIGEIMGVTRERIRQIEASALRKMRRSINVTQNRTEDYVALLEDAGLQ